MNIPDLFKSYTQLFISSQILKSPYHEIYDQYFRQNTELYETFLIMNQGVYIPLCDYFDDICKKEYHITYMDENRLSIHELNREILKYKSERPASSIDVLIERVQSHIFAFREARLKAMKYNRIIIHHYNYYLEDHVALFHILDSLCMKGSTITLFATVSQQPENQNQYKNRIRSQISSYTKMNLGKIVSLETILQSIPQNHFLVKSVLPYRESYYLGYGTNMIYKLTLEKASD